MFARIQYINFTVGDSLYFEPYYYAYNLPAANFLALFLFFKLIFRVRIGRGRAGVPQKERGHNVFFGS